MKDFKHGMILNENYCVFPTSTSQTSIRNYDSKTVQVYWNNGHEQTRRYY